MPAYTYEKVMENDHLPVRFENIDDSPHTVTAHWHEYLEILYVVTGKMTAIIQAETYRLSGGDILVINSKDIHMTQTHGENTHYLLLQISTKLLRQFFVNFDTLRFDTRIPAQPEEDSSSHPELSPARCLREMMQIYDAREKGYPLLFTSRLYELLYVLYREHSVRITPDSEKSTHRDFQRIIRIISWINLHYQEPLGLLQASGYLGLSREYFCRIFKKYTGQTFLEYVNDVRVAELYRELMDSDETITALMEKHGITNYKVFLRTFRKLYGDVPQKIRKRGYSADVMESEANSSV